MRMSRRERREACRSCGRRSSATERAPALATVNGKTTVPAARAPADDVGERIPSLERQSAIASIVMGRMTRRIPDAVLARHDVLVSSDNAFQRRARLLQALWREQRGYPVGLHRGRPLGSRIEAGFARDTLANFLTDGVREVVRHAVLGPGRSRDQLIDEDRLFANLLSSQPLCFNLFGEAALDLDLATRMFRHLAPERVGRVTAIRFEHSPGRGDLRFTADRSAFDVFVEYASPRGRRGFLGIEVKYHEALGDPAAEHRARYDELAEAMGCFVADRAALRSPPLQQIWRDHLLAGALVAAAVGYDEGGIVFLAPEANLACRRAVERYRRHLTDESTFACWSLEDIVDPFTWDGAATWCAELVDRYLAFERVGSCVLRESPRAPCPSCGGERWLPIAWGEPGPVAERMARRRELALGGCLVGEGDPDLECERCGHQMRCEAAR